MHEQALPYVLSLIVSATLCSALAVYARRRRSTPGANAFTWLMLAAAVWALAYALELGSATQSAKMFWIGFEYPGIVAAPVAWLAFALQYAGQGKWLARRNMLLLMAVPLVTLVMVWTSKWHPFFYAAARLDAAGPLPVLHLTHGWWFWIHSAYSYLLLIWGTYTLWQTFVRSPPLYRRQVGILLFGAFAPWLGNVLYLFDLTPFSHLDLTPFGFTLTGLAVVWGYFRYRLLDVMPAAREAIVENIDDGIIVLDVQDRIVDLNPAAGRILGLVASQSVGKPIDQIWPDHADWIAAQQDKPGTRTDMILNTGLVPRHCDIRSSPLHDRRGQMTGRLIVFHDISESRQAEVRQAHWNEMERVLSQASSRFVSPPDLDDAINEMLRDTGTVLNANRAYLFKICAGATRMDNTHEWVADGTSPQIENLQGLDPETLPWWMSKLYANQVIAASDVRQLPSPERDILEDQAIFSVLVIPIMIGKVLYGFLGFDETKRHREWESEEIGFLRNAAQILGRAFERAQAERTLQRRNAELAALNALAQALAGSLELHKMLDEALSCTAQALGFAGGLIWLVDEREKQLTLSNHAGMPESLIAALESQGAQGTLCEHVYKHGEPLNLTDLAADAPVNVQGLLQGGLRSYMGVPIVHQHHVLGTLCLLDYAPHSSSDTDYTLLASIGQQIGLAVENARLFAEARRRMRELELLYRVGLATASGVRMQASLQAAAEALAAEMPQARVAIMLLEAENNWLRMVANVGYSPDTVDNLRLQSGQGITGWVAHHGQPALVTDVTLDDRYIRAASETRSELCVPLIAAARVIGVLNVESPHVGAFGIDDQRLLNTLASNLAALVERARLFEEVVAARSELQRRANALEEANIRLQELDRLKDEFLANMSHEIRTPLNAVIGMTGLLLDTPLNVEQRELAETISSSGDTLLALINDILDFSKIESGKLELESQPFDVRHCVETALDLLAPKAAEKGIELVYHIDDQTPAAVVGDVTRLRQILVNLLSNAVKFTPTGEVAVAVAARRLESEQYKLHFTVRDTGIGIPPERMDCLFQSFSQVDASTTRRYGGTGLGLAISKSLTEMMGGTMWVESEVEKGSTFHFTVIGNLAGVQTSEQEQHPQLAGKHVLIVDDNETNRLILTQQVASWEMRPHAAASVAEALAWLRQGEPFDVALLDMRMPEMDGLTLSAEISQCGYPNLPIVMLTSLGQDAKSAAEPTFAAWLTKPVKPAQLHETLIGILAGQSIRAVKTVDEPLFDSQMGQRHPLRILLAEDNLMNQQVALRILERLGYRADVVVNGEQAVAAIERQTYDVVLMDVQMPEVDGVEATRRIRERWPVEQRPRIVAVTANAMKRDQERYLKAGMDDYVSKPVRVKELLAALERCHPISDRGAESPQASMPPFQAAAHDSDIPAIDDAVFEETRIWMGDAMAELIALFFDEASGLVAGVQEAADEKDAGKLQRTAHALKSSSANLGAARLGKLCQTLEVIARAGQLDDIAEKVAQVVAEYERVKIALEKERER